MKKSHNKRIRHRRLSFADSIHMAETHANDLSSLAITTTESTSQGLVQFGVHVAGTTTSLAPPPRLGIHRIAVLLNAHAMVYLHL